MTTDAATLQTSVQRAVQARIAALRAEAGIEPPDFVLTDDLERLVLIGSSSRGGSSIFSEVLRRTVDAVHLRAESNPFLRLYGLGPRGLEPRGEARTPKTGCRRGSLRRWLQGVASPGRVRWTPRPSAPTPWTWPAG